MLVTVRVTPNAKTARVKRTGETALEVRIDEQAVGGRANKRLREILSDHFDIPRSRITIVRGEKSRDKIVEIVLDNRAKLSAIPDQRLSQPPVV